MIDHIDHIVLTTRDKEASIRFYTEVLGMKLERFRTPTEERLALKLWSGWPTLPMIFVQGTLIGGSSDLRKAMADGTFQALLDGPRVG